MSINELRKWAETLSYWEKVALEKIMLGQQILETDYDEMLQYLMEDADLVEKSNLRRDIKFILSPSETDTTLKNSSILLHSISELKNINSLVTEQILKFGPKMTTIYGANGSGKSSYARILNCVAFSRGNKEILPNVLQGISNDVEKRAKLVISKDEQFHEIDFKIGDGCPELSSFYVFDSVSVQMHLKADELSFSPYMLSYLTRLVDVTDACRKRLQERLQPLQESHKFSELFQENTQISSVISGLSSKTRIKDLESLSLSLTEEKRLSELEQQIAEFSTVGTDNYAQIIADLNNLVEKISDVTSKINIDIAQRISNTVATVRHYQSALGKISVDQFKMGHVKGIGSNVWHEFIITAKNLAVGENRGEKGYPQQEDHCLLCQQPLDEQALSLIRNLWDFLAGDTQAKLDESKKTLEQIRELMCKVDLTLINQHVAYRYLEKTKPELAAKIAYFVKETTQLQQNCLWMLNSLVETEISVVGEDVIEPLRVFVELIISRQNDSEKKEVSQKLENLKVERAALHHKQLLKQYLPQIADYIERVKKVEKATKVAKDSKHISKKQNELFKQLVTDRYIETFEKNLESMGRNLKVEINTKANKGKTLRQLVLKVDKNATGNKLLLDRVLSEGEKRAVTIADFLTEIMLDESSRGIIFDDPVTSLDSEWKEVIAERLAEESLNRQVIIFTHDIHFLYLLKEHAEKVGSEVDSHWIKRGEHDDKPGYVFCGNSPMKDKDYLKPNIAQELLNKAKNAANPEEQLRLLRQGFGALRTTYEAFTIYNVFSGVVGRFEERISIGRLKEIVWNEDIIGKVINHFEKLSRYIEGHSHSDSFASKPPTTELLQKEINNYISLKKELNDLKNKKKPSEQA